VAPGITNVSAITELLASAALELRIEMIYKGPIPDVSKNGSILSLSYDGPILSQDLSFAPPAFGIPSLFLILAFLQAASSVFGSDMRRVKQRGRAALVKSASIGLLAQISFWLLLVALYASGLWALYGIKLDAPVFASLMGLALYAASLGGLTAFIGKRRYAVAIFIPWILLNMTLGGGLWNSQSGFGSVILPVSAVLEQSWSGAAKLWMQGISCFLIIALDIPKVARLALARVRKLMLRLAHRLLVKDRV
jgi:hypothetical protein